MTRVAVVDSGVANLASVTTALTGLAQSVAVTGDPRMIREATHVVLPGVGAFGSGMAALQRSGADKAVKAATQDGQPVLGICLGMQLLCEGSDEAPSVKGLGVIPGICRALPDSVRVPHLGWNFVESGSGAVGRSGYAAFANSYCLLEPPAGWRVAWTTHGRRFVAALGRDRVLACQFHPELSGRWGRELLARWLSGEGGTTARIDGGSHRTLTRRIVPCLDVRDGRVVKGVRFAQLRDVGDPAERAAVYEGEGADEIVLLDIAASPASRDIQLDTVRRVRARLGIPLTVGGGIRTPDDARRVLSAGADKVSVNSAAVRDPGLVPALANAFGTQCVVLAIDARRAGGMWEVLVNGGQERTGLDAVHWAAEGVRLGAGEILLTSWDRDGTRSGCDLDLLAAIRRTVAVPVIASGGVGSAGDAADAFHAGADAVLAASIFHDGQQSVTQLKAFLLQSGVPVRL